MVLEYKNIIEFFKRVILNPNIKYKVVDITLQDIFNIKEIVASVNEETIFSSKLGLKISIANNPDQYHEIIIALYKVMNAFMELKERLFICCSEIEYDQAAITCIYKMKKLNDHINKVEARVKEVKLELQKIEDKLLNTKDVSELTKEELTLKKEELSDTLNALNKEYDAHKQLLEMFINTINSWEKDDIFEDMVEDGKVTILLYTFKFIKAHKFLKKIEGEHYGILEPKLEDAIIKITQIFNNCNAYKISEELLKNAQKQLSDKTVFRIPTMYGMLRSSVFSTGILKFQDIMTIKLSLISEQDSKTKEQQCVIEKSLSSESISYLRKVVQYCTGLNGSLSDFEKIIIELIENDTRLVDLLDKRKELATEASVIKGKYEHATQHYDKLVKIGCLDNLIYKYQILYNKRSMISKQIRRHIIGNLYDLYHNLVCFYQSIVQIPSTIYQTITSFLETLIITENTIMQYGVIISTATTTQKTTLGLQNEGSSLNVEQIRSNYLERVFILKNCRLTYFRLANKTKSQSQLKSFALVENTEVKHHNKRMIFSDPLNAIIGEFTLKHMTLLKDRNTVYHYQGIITELNKRYREIQVVQDTLTININIMRQRVDRDNNSKLRMVQVINEFKVNSNEIKLLNSTIQTNSWPQFMMALKPPTQLFVTECYAEAMINLLRTRLCQYADKLEQARDKCYAATLSYLNDTQYYTAYSKEIMESKLLLTNCRVTVLKERITFLAEKGGKITPQAKADSNEYLTIIDIMKSNDFKQFVTQEITVELYHSKLSEMDEAFETSSQQLTGDLLSMNKDINSLVELNQNKLKFCKIDWSGIKNDCRHLNKLLDEELKVAVEGYYPQLSVV